MRHADVQNRRHEVSPRTPLQEKWKQPREMNKRLRADSRGGEAHAPDCWLSDVGVLSEPAQSASPHRAPSTDGPGKPAGAGEVRSNAGRRCAHPHTTEGGISAADNRIEMSL